MIKSYGTLFVTRSSPRRAYIELIASENYASPRVMQAQGSQLTNKYAEGYRVNAIMVVVNMWILLSS